MHVNLKNRHFLTLMDYAEEEILYLLDLARDLKEKKKKGIYGNHLKGKNIALIFEKPSTRTRCAFVVACNDEGAYPEYLGKNDIQLGHKESVEDTARVLGRMFDGIEYRGFSQKALETLAKYSGVPVWNGLTDADHPTQVLADFLTMQEYLGKLKGLKLVFVGDGRNNMSNALMIGAAKVGIHYVIAAPGALHPDEALLNACRGIAAQSGGSIDIMEDPLKAVQNAHVVYTDVWVSMGEEDKKEERIGLLQPYQVNRQLISATGRKDTLLLHCLPAVKGYEVTEDVFEAHAAEIFDEAENRLHTIKAVMVATLGDLA